MEEKTQKPKTRFGSIFLLIHLIWWPLFAFWPSTFFARVYQIAVRSGYGTLFFFGPVHSILALIAVLYTPDSWELWVVFAGSFVWWVLFGLYDIFFASDAMNERLYTMRNLTSDDEMAGPALGGDGSEYEAGDYVM